MKTVGGYALRARKIQENGEGDREILFGPGNGEGYANLEQNGLTFYGKSEEANEALDRLIKDVKYDHQSIVKVRMEVANSAEGLQRFKDRKNIVMIAGRRPGTERAIIGQAVEGKKYGTFEGSQFGVNGRRYLEGFESMLGAVQSAIVDARTEVRLASLTIEEIA